MGNRFIWCAHYLLEDLGCFLRVSGSIVCSIVLCRRSLLKVLGQADGNYKAEDKSENASASTDALLQAGILSYSRSKGLFVGAVLKGAVVSPDNDLNKAVYGMDAKSLLDPGRKLAPSQEPSVVQVFPETLASFSKK